MNEIANLIEDLKQQRNAIDEAIVVFEALENRRSGPAEPGPLPKRPTAKRVADPD